ncbi:methyltransferase family protein [Gemmobacter serpentinus]|uniref:methyltransferase family protein n=1 Tax=Gemmobacter serpentinus TaxID=2652247 RepID=UPI00124D8ADC|nr:methyltransferase [Gemmobacter serpentinus]
MAIWGWAAWLVLNCYLVMFFWGGRLAAHAAGREIWLFGNARGRDRLAALAFRAGFVLAALSPLLWLFVPWSAIGIVGLICAACGAMIAFAAQMSMGASWRVGVQAGQTGELVQGGLFTLSRNPTFLGQALLLAGIALAIPGLASALGLALFLWAAQTQIRSEERVLSQSLSPAYQAYLARVPRWIWPLT